MERRWPNGRSSKRAIASASHEAVWNAARQAQRGTVDASRVGGPDGTDPSAPSGPHHAGPHPRQADLPAVAGVNLSQFLGQCIAQGNAFGSRVSAWVPRRLDREGLRAKLWAIPAHPIARVTYSFTVVAHRPKQSR